MKRLKYFKKTVARAVYRLLGLIFHRKKNRRRPETAEVRQEEMPVQARPMTVEIIDQPAPARPAEGQQMQIEGTVFLHLSDTYIGSIEVPEGITVIGPKAFAGCSGLINIALPESLRRIEEAAFENCTGLMHIDLPEKVEYVAADAFRGCTALRRTVSNSHQTAK